MNTEPRGIESDTEWAEGLAWRLRQINDDRKERDRKLAAFPLLLAACQRLIDSAHYKPLGIVYGSSEIDGLEIDEQIRAAIAAALPQPGKE